MNVRHNAMRVTSLMTFANIKGGFNQRCKDVYFVRCIGWNEQLLNELGTIDKILSGNARAGQGKYVRIDRLPVMMADEDVSFYKHVYRCWEDSVRRQLQLKCIKGDSAVGTALAEALGHASEKFKLYTVSASESMHMNFLIKLFYWLDSAAGPLLENWNEKESCKFIYSGSLKKQEYLFLYLLTCLGIDVMILHPSGELNLDAGLLALSAIIKMPDVSDLVIPPFQEQPAEKSTEAVVRTEERPKVHIQQNNRRIKNVSSREHSETAELGFEALAQMASSVVMIEVREKGGKPVSTGSGIMIGRHGYILTNYHVIRDGQIFCIRIEDDQAIYQTDEVIKYNHLLDLALLRIDRELNPIRLYQGTRDLVRGQKVVAIGSPLGLFNSVSDGIISGFRNINHVEMIQFTAPISHGSSGGAVLNMMGEVIGISTAGFDSGQNINLAVNFKDIKAFVQGFIGT
ncbi:MAG: trypsin-like peptidase domain-containing protein [Lachnospiraceae bacterium]